MFYIILLPIKWQQFSFFSVPYNVSQCPTSDHIPVSKTFTWELLIYNSVRSNQSLNMGFFCGPIDDRAMCRPLGWALHGGVIIRLLSLASNACLPLVSQVFCLQGLNQQQRKLELVALKEAESSDKCLTMSFSTSLCRMWFTVFTTDLIWIVHRKFTALKTQILSVLCKQLGNFCC